MLSALQSLPSTLHDPRRKLAATLPGRGEVRVRRIVHRGAPRPVTKVPSIKLQRTVHCESVLEAEQSMIFDACPCVTWFAEQPVILHYRQRGEHKSHIPDFAVEAGRMQELVEVKFQRDVDDQVRARTALMVDLLAPHGIGYRLVTEREIRAGVALGNARKLLMRGREAVPSIWSLQAYEAVRRRGAIPLAEFGWHKPGSHDAAGIARQIMEGRLHLDMSREITPDEHVYASQYPTMENQLWQPAASK